MNNKLPTYYVYSPTSTPTRPKYTVAAGAAPGLDELLDSLEKGATLEIFNAENGFDVQVYYGELVSSGTGPTRMDAIRNAVAQATATQEGASE